MCVKVSPPGVLKETNLFSLALLGGINYILFVIIFELASLVVESGSVEYR